MAGFSLSRFVSHSVSICSSSRHRFNGSRTFVIVESDHLTFNVSVWQAGGNGSPLAMVARRCDSGLGERDFDAQMIEYLKALFAEETGWDMSGDRKALDALAVEVPKIKNILKKADATNHSFYGFHNEFWWQPTLKRVGFERCCRGLLDRSAQLVRAVLADARVRAADVDEIFLLGNTLEIPVVRRLLQYFFPTPIARISRHPEEDPVIGATLIAAHEGSLGSDDGFFDQESLTKGAGDPYVSPLAPPAVNIDQFLDGARNPLSLGMATRNGEMVVLIPRFALLPIQQRAVMSGAVGHDTNLRISIYEGEEVRVADNHLIGEVVLSGRQSGPSSPAKVAVTISLNEDLSLTVSAEDTQIPSRAINATMSAQLRLSGDQLAAAIARAKPPNSEQKRL
jgi:molecular chaperone DnaK (HSP70)